MTLQVRLKLAKLTLNPLQQRRIERQMQMLERRLVHHPRPSASVVLTAHPQERQIQADVRVRLGPLGPSLISHQSAETPDAALRAAVNDLKRQLERKLARQRGEHTFGVPSRRQQPDAGRAARSAGGHRARASVTAHPRQG